MGQRYTRWSLRRLSIGVVSVAVSSGVFVLEHDARPGCPRGDHGYADHDGHRYSCQR
ncbi:YSIRK-type signal peptide-containing protein [Limosilactobacillus fermentum]|nr:YSIRK-type signal peptide-containing protein [Limosilactobacillus fermentum]